MPTSHWNPKRTRAFIVSIAQFEGKKEPDFSIEDRLDPAFVKTLQKLGVPAGQITHLQDKAATAKNLREQFSQCLRASQPDEQLIFYFGSHGDYTANRDEFRFSAYDEYLPVAWAFETIEKEFKGSQALLFPDCCYSGGMVEMLAQRPHKQIAYAALSSTHAHNIAWNGWSFIDCLIRSMTGDARMDLGRDGYIDWGDLCQFTERHMAFLSDGKPIFATCNGFDPHLRFSEVAEPLADPQIGQYVQVLWENEWYNAEILETRGEKYKIRYVDSDASSDEWVTEKRMRGVTFVRFWVGAPVEMRSSADDEWYPGRVLQAWESLHFCQYDEYGPEYDEWFGPSRIRRKTGK
jgi:hypothetical protein